MDKKLLDSLNNLSLALEEIAGILAKKGSSSSSGAALESGDFSKDLKEISSGIKSIKSDTQEILKSQKTILEMSKKKSSEKKTPMEEIGGDKKKESNLKKGVGTILLIAIAVLAIGMAFKLVGKIDFLSVIGLGLAMVIIAVAFEKIARLDLSLKRAFVASLTMVMISVAITLSSWVLKMIMPIGFTQLLTAIFIAATFAAMSKHLENIFIATAVFRKLRVSKFALVTALVSIATAIAISSWVLAMIRPIGITQGLTGILIAGIFAVISVSMHKIGVAVTMFDKLNVKPLALVTTLVAISTAIAISSWILNMIRPMSIGQSITGILIAVMFMVISFNLEKIAIGVVAFKRTKVNPLDLIKVLVGIAGAIALSSWVLGLTRPIGIWQFLTALGITILFAIMSYFMDKLAFGVVIVEKVLGKGKIFLIPLVLVAIAAAIMLSSHILAKTKDITFMMLFKILILGAVLALLTTIFVPAVFVLGKMSVSALIKGTIAIVVIAAAIMVSSHILALGNYKKYPDWKWALGVGLAILAFAPGIVLLGLLAMADGGLSQLLGAVMVLIVATAIMATSHILALGNYKKSPPILWTLAVLAVMVPFAIGMVALGMIAVTGIGAIALLLGAGMILVVALTINETAKILNKGKFDKYPPIKWTLGVLAVMVPFTLGMVALGMIAVTGIGAIALLLGAGMILVVALTINETAKILNKGTYGNFPSLAWTLSVGLSMTGFGVAMLALGTIIVASLGLGYLALEAGSSAVLLIAETIVSAGAILSKGNFKGGPTADWALGVAIAMGAFAPIYGMLMASAIFDLFGGGGVSPQDFADAIVTVCDGIVTAAKYFAENTSAFVGGPSKAWAEGIGLAIGAFAPVYKVLQDNTGMFASGVSPTDMKNAIMTISQGIVDAAKFFAENTSPFSEGNYPSKKWGEGVGAALGAFAPVFKALSEDTGWFTDGSEVVDNMLYGIKSITRALVNSGTAFAKAGAVWGSYPSDKWAEGVKSTIVGFLDIFSIIGERGYSVSSFKMYSAILNGAISNIASSAKSLWMSQNYFKFKLDKSWVKNVGENVLPYALITQQLDKMLGFDEKTAIKSGGFLGSSIGQKTTTTTTRKMKDVSIINRIISQIVETAIILTAGQKYFKFKLDKSWVMDLSKSVIGYAAITQQLDKMLGFDEKTAIKSGGFLGSSIGQKTTTTTTRQMKDVSIVNRVVSQIIDTARILHINQNFFKFKLDRNWVYDLHWNLENYAKLAKKLEKILTIADISKISLGVFGQYSVTTTKTADIGIVNKVVNQLIMTASILHKNKNVFGFKIDPNYMDNISTNVLTFADLANKLAKKQKGQSVMDEVLGIDPISRAARGMVKIADAYTTLAKAVKSFSGAINSLNVGKLNAFRVLTGNLAMLSALDSNMFSNMLSVLESRSGVFANMLQMQTAEISRRPQVNVGGGGAGGGAKDKNSAQPKDSKGETQLQKLDKVIYLLKKISNEAQGINEHLHDPTGANNSDVGSKGDG